MNKLFELKSGIDGVFYTNCELLVKISNLPNLFFNLFSFLANPQFLSLHSLVHFLLDHFLSSEKLQIRNPGKKSETVAAEHLWIFWPLGDTLRLQHNI